MPEPCRVGLVDGDEGDGALGRDGGRGAVVDQGGGVQPDAAALDAPLNVAGKCGS